MELREAGVKASILALVLAACATVLLASLHVLSPEFSPAWRMVSEYANGHYAWVLSLMFAAYGLSLLTLAYAIRSRLETRAAKVGLVLLVIAGIGAASASVFDINQEALHELAGILGITCLPIAAVLITRTLVRTEPWSGARNLLLWLANLTWITVVLWVASFILMIATFVQVLGGIPSEAPKEVPAGAIALVGWTNRLLLLSVWAWVVAVAWVGTQSRSNRASGGVVRRLTVESPESSVGPD